MRNKRKVEYKNEEDEERHESPSHENDVNSDQILTENPTPIPTRSPTSSPTAVPTSKPTSYPTRAPTSSPTRAPTHSPTSKPSSLPTSSPSSSPTASPTPLPLCYPDKNGNYGKTKGPDVFKEIVEFLYEIESKPSTNVNKFMIEKVQSEISATVLGDLFGSCARYGGLRRLDEEDTSLTGFSSKPKDVVDENGCREKDPANGNVCTSIAGSFTLFGMEESIDTGKALDSIKDAMADDLLIHVDESIVKINYVALPPMEQSPVAKDPVTTASAESSGGSGFNMGLMAFIPFGAVCLAVIIVVIRKQRKMREFDNLSHDSYDERDLSESRINWKDAKLDQTSSDSSHVHFQNSHYISQSDIYVEEGFLESTNLSFQESETSNGFEMNLLTPDRLK